MDSSDLHSDLFLHPKTTQHGSHMVMTNVLKPTRTKIINIDTRFRDEYNYNDDSYYNVTLPDRFKYNVTLPERITNAKTITIKSVEIPMSFYNISSNLGNNQFTVTNNTTNITSLIIVPDGYYTRLELSTAIQPLLNSANAAGMGPSNSNINVNIDSNKHVYFTANCPQSGATTGVTNGVYTDYTYTFQFATNDKYNFKSSLGWILGFRSSTFQINSNHPGYNASLDPTALVNLPLPNQLLISEQPYIMTVPALPKYLYLSIDEFNKGVQNSFVTPLANAFINKSAIARIAVDYKTHDYGSVLVATNLNGLLVSDTRNYNGKIDLQKLNIQLFNESGMPIDLNGQDFSFSMEVAYE